ncbi:hypothetical protein ZOD2009_07439 [Haladaptatus paucihalophilus DX253]|uniref:Uncharacterized protein n=1 Tax=Haladaptatus paucihalophilus DX253 TaxID=797209 RepID=E7QRR5_HALPU|nr:hypothetical protein ZOD2009_07439 [Haladaptatus paucihalophilus DX253]SHK15821.1 hypothetical protein SAMN05444342_0773 [Haladaptatus paucihalophilus DX253]
MSAGRACERIETGLELVVEQTGAIRDVKEV